MSARSAQVSPSAVLLVAHGSADPAAATSTRALARAVSAARPGLVVRTGFLDHTRPAPGEALATLAAEDHRDAVVVPLLLTAAYHRRVDLPEVLACARAQGVTMPVRMAQVLGPVAGTVPEQLLAALRRRLPAPDLDAVVLAAAGTRDGAARATVDEVAEGLGAQLGLPCRVAYAAAAAPTPETAVTHLRRAGARRVGVAAYFLAPGRLYRLAVAQSQRAGAGWLAAPLGAAPELAQLVLARVDAASAGCDSAGSARSRSGEQSMPASTSG